MKIKHDDIVIPPENPFENCKLGRKKYAQALTGIISSYKDGFVLAINNEWGTGKTTFIKMWQQHLENAEYRTLYFNAWENDFESNPLVAILSELKTMTSKKNDKTFKELLKKGAVITKSVLPVISEAIAKKYIDTEGLTKAIGKLTEAASDILKEEVDDYANKKQGLVEFRKELEIFIQENNNGKPLIFLIDELDRCRPDYAVEVLEKVKHFFNVKGIIFVLSIDKTQLSNAIKGFYGSEHIDSYEYLRRFIDLEYVLPKPETSFFSNYLYHYFEFDDFLFSPERKVHRELSDDKKSLLTFSNILFESNNTTLRQQEKIFSHARVVLNLFKEDNYIFPSLYILLIYIKVFLNTFYQQIRERRLTPQDLLNELQNVFLKKVHEDDINIFVYTEALLTLFYNNYYTEIDYKSELMKFNDATKKNELLVKSKTDEKGTDFLRMLETFERKNFDRVKINFLMDKIDLLDSLPI